MANKEWWETFSALDCMYLWSYNQLSDYIQHSACTDFIIHSTCTDTGQAFKFTQLGILSILEGGDSTGDDLIIYSNSIDQCSYIKLFGDGGITAAIEETSSFVVSTCSAESLLVVSASALTYKGTSICLSPCGGGSGSCPTKSDLPFTMYDDCDAETGVGFQFTISGVLSTFTGSNSTGDDLLVTANSVDACSWMKLFGNEGIQMAIKATSIFEVSTCSLETLFEVDTTPTDKHCDFHCLDAHNFVLELRTTDPTGPTCTGRIWFRTDLV